MKKFFSTLLILALVLCFIPTVDITKAYAAGTLESTYSLNSIDAPKTVYMDVERYSSNDWMTIYASMPENIYQMLMELDLDEDAFNSKYGVESAHAFVQVDVKVDNGAWHGTYDGSSFDEADDSSNFSGHVTYTPERITSFLYTIAGKDNDSYEHDYWNGIYASKGLDLKNHTITFKLRWGVSYYDPQKADSVYIHSNNWSTWSIGKNGTQVEPKKPTTIPAAVISDLRTEMGVNGAEVRYTQEFPKEMDTYQMYADLNNGSIGSLEGQIRVNGGAWKNYSISNAAWWTNGERKIVIGANEVPFKKGDSIEFRMRIAGGTYGNSDWSNVIYLGASAKLAKYNAITAIWSPVDRVEEYHVYYKKASEASFPSTYTTVSKEETSVTFESLAAGTQYNIKVVPCYINTVGAIEESDLYYQASETTLKKVTGLKVAKSGTKVKVSWSGVTNADGYQVYQSTKKTGSTSKGYVSTKSKTLTATKGKTYYYKVRAYKVVDGAKVYAPACTVKAYKR